MGVWVCLSPTPTLNKFWKVKEENERKIWKTRLSIGLVGKLHIDYDFEKKSRKSILNGIGLGMAHAYWYTVGTLLS